MRALLSVSDKTGITELAAVLSTAGYELLSTGGTARYLRNAGLTVRDVSEVTGFPEILGGRVKTLHPAVHGGILARRDDAEHHGQLAAHGIEEISIVVVNLYPFARTAADPAREPLEVVEEIDIGGVALLRAAAKNHQDVIVLCDAADFSAVATILRSGGTVSREQRSALAAKAFAHTAAYDSAIAAWFARSTTNAELPDALTVALPTRVPLRYGENPHQRAALYLDASASDPGITRATQLQGKELSYNNILDGDGALEIARDFRDFPEPVAVIVKHGNPCGIALGETLAVAFDRARAGDPDSAFGGIIATNSPVDAAAAEAMATLFLEVIIAPSFSNEALAVLAKKKNLRLLSTGVLPEKSPQVFLRSIVGGVLATDRDVGTVAESDWRVVSTAQPTEGDRRGLLFAWRCAKWVKSNAIVYTNQHGTIGIGAGQMSRVDSARIGAEKARASLAESYMASDAFLPFRDGVDAAARHGIRAIIQPGGSIRDEEVIAAANEHGMVMVFTGMRHFRH